MTAADANAHSLRRVLRATLWLLLALLGTVVLLLAVAVALLRGDAATRWALQSAHDLVPQLSFEQPRGNLIDGLQLQTLRWQAPDFELVMDEVSLRLRWRDLLRARATIDPLHAVRLLIHDSGPSSPGPVKLPTLVTPLLLHVPHIAVDRLVVRNGAADTVLTGIRGDLTWLGPSLRLRGAHLDYAGLRLAADAGIRFIGGYPVTLQGHLTGSALPGSAAVKARGSLRRLRLDANLDGPWPTALEADLRLLDDHLPFRLTAHLTQPVTRDAGVDTVSIRQAELAASGTLAHFTGKAEVHLHDQRYDDATLTASLDGSTDALGAALLLTATDTQIRSDCRIQANTPAHWQCNGKITSLTLAPWLGGAPGTLNGPFTVGGQFGGGTALTLALPAIGGTLGRDRLAGAIDLASPDFRRWDISALQLRAGGNRLDARGSIGPDSRLSVRVHAPALAQLHRRLAGSLSADLALTGDIAAPSVRGSLALRNGAYDDLRVGSADAHLAITRLGRQTSSTTLTLHRLNVSGQQLDADLGLQGTRADHRWRLDIHRDADSARLACRGALDDAGHYRLDCPTLEGTLAISKRRTVVWHQQTALTARWDLQRQQGGIDGFCLRGDGASLCATPGLAYRQHQWQPFRVQLRQLPLRWWRRALPAGLHLANNATADADLRFGRQRPLQLDAELRIEASQWRWHNGGGAAHEMHLDAVTARAELGPDKAHLTTNLHAPELGRVAATVDLLDPLGARRLQGRVDLTNIQLAAFGWALPDIDTLRGSGDGHIAIAGTAAQPQLNGQLAVHDGYIDSAELGAPISDLTARLRFDNQRADLDGSFRVGKGNARVQGAMQWADGIDAWHADLHLTGTGLAVEPLAGSKVVFAPDVTLNAAPHEVRLRGNLQVQEANIRIQQLPPETIDVSSDAVVVGRQQQQPPAAVDIDLGLNLGQHTHFSGFGADVDLAGQLRWRQQPRREPQLTGRIDVTDGRYRAYGQRLIVRKGQFIFTGNPDNPDLNLEAVRELPPGNNDTIGLRISGTLHDPVAKLFSDQSLSESDMAYYLLTGRKRNPNQSVGDFSAGGTLLSLGLAGGENQAAKLAQKFGIQGLQLGTAAASNGGTEAEVSGYVFRDLYVRYGRTLGQGTDSVTLQYHLSPHLLVQTISGIEETLDLIYTFTLD